jgi:hypothetical protein
MSEKSVSIAFKIVGLGSAECDLHIGSQTYSLKGLSDTTDALGDLVRLALMIECDAQTATARFDHEPAESRLWAHNIGGLGGLFLKVLQFDSIYANEPDHAGQIVFSAECGASEFAEAVLEAGKRLWNENKDNLLGGFPFPYRALCALETALAARDRPLPT